MDINPVHDKMFYAAKGKGAFVNGQPTRVSDRTKLSEALIMYDNQLHKSDDMFANFHSGNLQFARYRCLLGRLRSSRCKDMAQDQRDR